MREIICGITASCILTTELMVIALPTGTTSSQHKEKEPALRTHSFIIANFFDP
jgi:hypothetical protein